MQHAAISGMPAISLLQHVAHETTALETDFEQWRAIVTTVTKRTVFGDTTDGRTDGQ